MTCVCVWPREREREERVSELRMKNFYTLLFPFYPSHWEILVQFMNRKQLIFDVVLSSKWPSNPWTTLQFSPQWIRNLFLSPFLICFLPLQPLFHSDLEVEMACVCRHVRLCVGTHVHARVCVSVCVSYNLSPTVTKWFDRPCHRVDKWWIGTRWDTIKPVNLLADASSHLPSDEWPVNTQTNKGSRHIPSPHYPPTHTHTHTLILNCFTLLGVD